MEAWADEAALAHGEGRFVHQRLRNARTQIRQSVQIPGQLAQPAGREMGELCGHGGQFFNSAAQRGHIPPAGGAVYNAADKALDVPDAGQGQDQLFAGHSIFHQGGHSALALSDGGGGKQGTLQKAAQAPGSHGRFRFVQHPQKAPALFLAAQGFRQFQVAPGGHVQLHKFALLIVIQIVYVRKVCFLRLIKVAEQAAQRHSHGGNTLGEGLERLFAELLAYGALGGGQIEGGVLTPFAVAVEPVAEEFVQSRMIGGCAAQHHLRGGETAQFVDEVAHRFRSGKGGSHGPAGGYVDKAHAGAVVAEKHGADVVAAAVLQHRTVGYGAGGDYADDVPLHQPLGRGRILHLLTDGHFVALGNQAGNVALAGVVGHAAHGSLVGLVLAPVPGGQGEIQFPRGSFGVLPEHLIEIAQTEEKKGAGVGLFQFYVLLHHRREFSHAFTSYVFSFWSVGRNLPEFVRFNGLQFYIAAAGTDMAAHSAADFHTLPVGHALGERHIHAGQAEQIYFFHFHSAFDTFHGDWLLFC